MEGKKRKGRRINTETDENGKKSKGGERVVKTSMRRTALSSK